MDPTELKAGKMVDDLELPTHSAVDSNVSTRSTFSPT